MRSGILILKTRRSEADKDLLAWAVERGSGCIWLEDSPRTYVRGFKHRLITTGRPVRMGLHRLSRADTEWVEKQSEKTLREAS